MAYIKSLLWELSGFDGKKSYLFGSIHFSSGKFEVVQLELKQFIQNCEICAIEVDVDEASLVDLTSYHHISISDQSYFLGENKKWNKLNLKLSRVLNFSLENYNHLKPLVLLNIVLAKLLSIEKCMVLDEWIWHFAKSMNKITLGLETVEEHFNVLNKISLKSQVSIFFHSLKNLNKLKIKFFKLLKHYINQDIRYLYKDAKKNSGVARQLLIHQRNILMSDKLLEFMKSNSVFAAVGAAHLYGKNGMINLLKSKGIKVTAVKLNFS